jgi:hypothetical protein
MLMIVHIACHKTLDQNETMRGIGRIYQLKDGSIGEPSMYLGANIDYIHGALKTVTADLQRDAKQNGKADWPFNISYHAELDATLHLDAKLIH